MLSHSISSPSKEISAFVALLLLSHLTPNEDYFLITNHIKRFIEDQLPSAGALQNNASIITIYFQSEYY